jgi:hypothetical protein
VVILETRYVDIPFPNFVYVHIFIFVLSQGAVIGRFVIDDSSLCFINCHLAAGQHQTRQRGRDIAAILEERALFPENSIVEPVAFTNGGGGSMVLDHEIVFVSSLYCQSFLHVQLAV